MCIRDRLAPGGVVVVEAPYVRDMIDHGEFDTIYHEHLCYFCLLYTSDAADERSSVDLGGRRIIKKTNTPSRYAAHSQVRINEKH